MSDSTVRSEDIMNDDFLDQKLGLIAFFKKIS